MGSGASLLGARPAAAVDCDYGDAPASYGPACHAAEDRSRLGPLYDFELAVPSSVNADGDDTSGIDDEDGITMPAAMARGSSYSVTIAVYGETGFVSAWFDFDRNGTFDADEQVLDDALYNIANHTITVDVPLDASLGLSYARFRIHSSEGLDPSIEASDGEVEDYAFEIVESDLAFAIAEEQAALDALELGNRSEAIAHLEASLSALASARSQSSGLARAYLGTATIFDRLALESLRRPFTGYSPAVLFIRLAMGLKIEAMSF